MARPRAATRFLVALLGLIALLSVSVSPAYASTSEPQLDEAREAIIVDSEGRVLWERNAHERMALASITKVMTAIVALDSDIALDEPISLVAVSLPGDAQTVEIKDGETWTFEKLLEVTLVFSANDAATNVAIAVAGSEEAFAELMNAKAAEIGMKDTHFVNPHGLEHPEHYSCAYDVALMGRYAMDNYPEIVRMVSMHSVSVKRDNTDREYPTTDRFIKEYEGALGIKTGNTESGSTFCGAAERLGARLYSCVLGCETSEGRWHDTYELFDWAYKLYGSHTLANSELVVRRPHYAFRFGQRLEVICERSLVRGIWPGENYSFERIMTQPNVLCIPGMPYAGVSFRQGGRHLGSRVWSCGHELHSIPSFGPLNTRFFTGELIPHALEAA